MLRILLILLGLVALAHSAPLYVAVNDLAPKGVSENDASILGDRLRSELLATGTFRVMERGQMDQILKEQTFQKSGACDQSECAIEIGKLLSVDRMIVGSVGHIGDLYTIQARLLDVQTGEIVFIANQDYEGKIEGLMSKSIPELARRLAAGAGGLGKPAPVVVPATADTASTKSDTSIGGSPQKPGASQVVKKRHDSAKSVSMAAIPSESPRRSVVKTWVRWGAGVGFVGTGIISIFWHREALTQRAKAAKAVDDYKAATIGFDAYKSANARAVDYANYATTKSGIYAGFAGVFATTFALTFAF